jgi:hypothetical protein
VRERGFTQAGWTVQEHMLERITAALGGCDSDSEPLDQVGLTYVLSDISRPKGPVLLLVDGCGSRGGDKPVRSDVKTPRALA